MPYASVAELPAPVRENLPNAAQQIYKEAFNNAWDQYADPKKRKGRASRETTAHRVAWSAVKTKYEKRGDRWVRKGR
jgi:cation transport regulator